MLNVEPVATLEVSSLEGYNMVEDVSSSNRYFQRRLRVVNLDGSVSVFTEEEFFALSGPKVVLGEPGMGKTELVEQASRRLKIEAISAVRFMNSKRPEQFVQLDRLLLIDGLDEAMARKDGDAVDKVLDQLDTIDLPDFLLTCRAREWQARSQSALNKLYKANVHIATLEPLSREEASEFLVTRFSSVDAEYVLSHIERHGVADLYANPLMLRLMGQVAMVSDQLPATRADLLAKVCSLLWPEHDMERQEVSRLRLAEDEALSSAGAIMASLLFAGAETVSIAAMNQLDDGEVSLAEIERLPGAEKASLLLASKLFVSQGPGRAKPIHRLIAEYLEARWVAGLATTGRRRRRLLSSIWESGGIPASLRGLYAWLAYHSSSLALDIIRADPFGVLRYGETSHYVPPALGLNP